MKQTLLHAALWLLFMAKGMHSAVLPIKRADLENSRQERQAKGGPDFTEHDACIFLEKYGYLDPTPSHVHSQQALSDALRDYQGFFGLQQTGQLDKKTVDLMKQPRCGMPDKVRPSEASSGAQNFTITGYRWTSRDHAYKMLGYTPYLSQSSQLSAVAYAFNLWSSVSTLNFRRITSGPSTFTLSFASRDHGDGAPFDGPWNVVAHAFPPGPSPYAGQIHFDIEEYWTVYSQLGVNFERAACHEIGHTLGLGHSPVPAAMMYPTLSYFPYNQLHSDDIAGAQHLYGARTAALAPPIDPVPAYPCPQRYDAVEQVHNGQVYIFFGDLVYTLINNSLTNPTKTKLLYPGAPNSPDAVVYEHSSGYTFIFKGGQYWRYTGFTKSTGYPRPLQAGFHHVIAGLYFGNSQIYLFKGSQFFVWNEQLTANLPGYPREISTFWTGLPANINAAFRSSDGYYYFIKQQDLWAYNSNGVLQAGYPKTIGWCTNTVN